MFEAATLKLTGWYLLIIMVISLLFSLALYQAGTWEVQARLDQYTKKIPNALQQKDIFDSEIIEMIKQKQGDITKYNILIGLVYFNIFILISGGLTSYYMASKTLRPLKRAHEMESQFVSDASHELRTPLTTMKTELELSLRDVSITKNEMKDTLSSTLEEVNRLTELSNSLLMMSKIEHSGLATTKIDLNSLINSVINRDDLKKRIKFKNSQRPITISGHRPSIVEVLIILIDNAIKYSPPESDVTVSLARRYRSAEIKITNQGSGISSSDLPYIFDRFYQADNSRTNGTKPGYGLGLSLAKKIINLHSGEISASSIPGKLTEFKITLPLYRK